MFPVMNDPTLNMSDSDKQNMLHSITMNTIQYRIKEWVTNFSANVPKILGGKGTASLFEKLKGVPSIIIGSGPTLDWNIRQLTEYQNRACIIACDSALKTLLEVGITPHIMMVTDSKERVSGFLEGVDLSKINVVADSFIHPKTRDLLKSAKRLYWYSTLPVEAEPWTAALNQWTGYIGNLGTGGCVATTAWWFAARFLASDPCVLVGLPEAFYDPGQMYAPSVAKNNETEPYNAQLIKTLDFHGLQCFTFPALQSFAYWFEDAFLNTPMININCSEGGIIQRNILNMPLLECVKRYLTVDQPIEHLLFVNERIIEDMILKTKSELVEKWRNMLMILLDGPSLPNLALRMGMTDNETHQIINDLRDQGLQIDENVNQVQNPYGGEPTENLVFTLTGYSIGADNVRVQEASPVPNPIIKAQTGTERQVVKLAGKYSTGATSPKASITATDFHVSQIISEPVVTDPAFPNGDCPF